MDDDESNKEYRYISLDDLLKLPDFDNKTTIALCNPKPGTVVEYRPEMVHTYASYIILYYSDGYRCMFFIALI